jgi:L-arabinose 1-dehydrogenase [NAD(P)+]
MVRIAVTGAAGTVGRVVLEAFGDEHEVVPFTHSEETTLDSEHLDVTDPGDVETKLEGFDIVIHLAGASSPDADWETVSETNIQGTKHVLDAAIANGVDRVVYASSNHVVGTYNAAKDVPGDGQPRRSQYSPCRRADVAGLLLRREQGRLRELTTFYANRYDLDVVNLRIGWHMTEQELRATTSDDVDPGTVRFARAVWLSPPDCRDIHRKAATADLSRIPITVNPISRNDDRYFTITEAMRSLGYRPRDNVAEVLDS